MFAKATAQNLVYRLFDIPPENFRREALRLFAGGLKGLNVTLPHKQAAAELVNELTPRAERAKAVNTIAFFEQTSLLGDNTDGLGLMADLENNLGLALTGKRVLILGAGGAVRGVLGSLMEREVRELVIANRTPERARKLAAEFADLGEISGCGFAEVQGPALRSHHQRHLGQPAGRDAGDAGRAGERREHLLRHGLRPRAYALYVVGEILARGAYHQGLGHAGRTGRGVFSAVARHSPRHGPAARGTGAARCRAGVAGTPQRMVTSSSALVG